MSRWPGGKASASRGADLDWIPTCPVGLFPGRVIPERGRLDPHLPWRVVSRSGHTREGQTGSPPSLAGCFQVGSYQRGADWIPTFPGGLFPGRVIPERGRLGLDPHLPRGVVSRSGHTSDLNIGTAVATLPGFVGFVCWLLNAPATCECITGVDLLRQFNVLPH